MTTVGTQAERSGFQAWAQKAAIVLAMGLALFHLYTAAFGSLAGIMQRVVHFCLVMVLAVLIGTKKASSRWAVAFRVILLLVTVTTVAYTIWAEPKMSDVKYIGLFSTQDTAIGILFLAAMLFITFEQLGAALPVIVLVAFAYMLYGHLLPAPFGHPFISVKRMVEYMYFSPEGIWGIAMGASATYLILFVIFGAVLMRSGLSELIYQVGRSAFRTTVGGPAKIAVLASSVVAMVTGSDMANAAAVGSFTIPLMKRSGYKAEFAGAVEAIASNGAQVMPPVLGTAGFLMAEILGRPYSEVMIAALVPGILYYVSVFLIIHLYSIKFGLSGVVDTSDQPVQPARRLLMRNLYMFVPMVLLIVLVVYGEVSIVKTGLWVILSAMAVTLFRFGIKIGAESAVQALIEGAKGAVQIALACGLCGIIIGMFGATGLGMSFTEILLSAAGNSLFWLVILTAIASLILGTGLPTLVTYVVLAVLVAPALIKAGINPFAAHLFIFWFGNVSSITPPVALAAMVTAGIAQSDPFKTANEAFKLGFVSMLVPFAFLHLPGLLLVGTWSQILMDVLTALLAVGGLSIGMVGYGLRGERYGWVQRLLVAGGGGVLLLVDFPWSLAGLLGFLPLLWRVNQGTPVSADRTVGASETGSN